MQTMYNDIISIVGQVIPSGGWLYCTNPGEGNCPDKNACNQYCLSKPFPGGGVCVNHGKICCCKG